MFRGIFTPAVTLFREDGSIDADANHGLFDFLIGSGVQGIFINSTTGEFMHMHLRDREQHAADAVAHINGRCPVIIGTGSTATRDTIRLSRHAQGIGADAVAIITPYFWTLSEREVLAHMSAVANAVDLPILIYNFPAYSNFDISNETLSVLIKENPNIKGIIDNVDNYEHLRARIQTIKAIDPEFTILAGNDGYTLNMLVMGGDGTVPPTSNLVPDQHVTVFNAFESGRFEVAVKAMEQVVATTEIFRITGSFHSVLKEAMVMAGIIPLGASRPPALPLNMDSKTRLRQILERSGVLAPPEAADRKE